MLGITICATPKYAYALKAQATAVQAAVVEARRRGMVSQVSLIFATSDNKLANDIGNLYKGLIPNGFNFEPIILGVDDKFKSHKTKAQKNIAILRTAAFNKAKALDCDHVWSLDSDVLPKHNSLSASFDMLQFDEGFYQVISCPYPSQGGGGFLCGRGTFREHILRDIYDDEKDVNPKIIKRIDKYRKEEEILGKKLKDAKKSEENDKLFKRMILLGKKISLWRKFIRNKARPKDRNVFKLNGKKWRKRGWFDFAYPAIGKGSVVPTDWTGFGCVLMTQKALNIIDFHGYDGRGTEDLFITWQRWYLNGIKIAALPHCPADHVIRVRGKKDEYSHIFTYHEPDGECEGHLRQEYKEFNQFL